MLSVHHPENRKKKYYLVFGKADMNNFQNARKPWAHFSLTDGKEEFLYKTDTSAKKGSVVYSPQICKSPTVSALKIISV